MNSNGNTMTMVPPVENVCGVCGHTYPPDTIFAPEDGGALHKGDSLIGQDSGGEICNPERDGDRRHVPGL